VPWRRASCVDCRPRAALVDDCLLLLGVSRRLCICIPPKPKPKPCLSARAAVCRAISRQFQCTGLALTRGRLDASKPAELQHVQPTSCVGCTVACTLRARWWCREGSTRPRYPISLPQVEPYPSAKHCGASLMILHMQPLAALLVKRPISSILPPTLDKDLHCTPLFGICYHRNT
jgi:hypothetical protein